MSSTPRSFSPSADLLALRAALPRLEKEIAALEALPGAIAALEARAASAKEMAALAAACDCPTEFAAANAEFAAALAELKKLGAVDNDRLALLRRQAKENRRQTATIEAAQAAARAPLTQNPFADLVYMPDGKVVPARKKAA